MATTKLISFRVDEDDLSIIDNAVAKNGYRKRSDYMNAALRLMAWASQNGKADQILRFHPHFGDVVDSFDFKYHRQHR